VIGVVLGLWPQSAFFLSITPPSSANWPETVGYPAIVASDLATLRVEGANFAGRPFGGRCR
jgi:hypothetical protein